MTTGLFVGRVSDKLQMAVKAPALLPIFDTLIQSYRSIILAEAAAPAAWAGGGGGGGAAAADVCITDEQIQTYFMPWTAQVKAQGPLFLKHNIDDHFAKTGSGQTYIGKEHSNKCRFLAVLGEPRERVGA